MKNLNEYGLKRIPFKSLATDTGQYEIVFSRPFNELISEIDNIRAETNKEAAAIIIQGPQGSGKTATKKGIKQRFETETRIVIIHFSLNDIELFDILSQIINDAKEQRLVDQAFLKEIDYSPIDIKK